MSRMMFNKFYFENGVRRKSDISTPTPHTQPIMLLPKMSLMHYLGNGIDDVGPTSSTSIFSYSSTKVHVLIIAKPLEPLVGKPRTTTVPVSSVIQDYHSKNTRFKRILKSVKFFNDSNEDVVISYSLAFLSLIYNQHVLVKYYQWRNKYNTLWKTVAETAEVSDRNQFIFIDLPDTIPALTKLKNLEGGVTTKFDYAARYNEDEFNVLDFFIWIGDKRENALMNVIPQKHLNKVNVVLQHKGRWILINLAVLDNLITRKYDVSDENVDLRDTKGTQPEQMQKEFLAGLIRLVSSEESAVETSIVASTTRKDNKAKPPISTPEQKEKKKQEREEEEVAEDHTVEELAADSIDSLLDEHERIDTQRDNRRKLKEQEGFTAEDAIETVTEVPMSSLESLVDLSSVEPYSPSSTPQHKIAAEKARELVEKGSISLNEYNKLVALTDLYQDIPIPRFLGVEAATLGELVNITDKDIEFKPDTIRDINTVTDKSMLRMSLKNYDKEIEKDLLPKLFGACILGFQKKGYVIQALEIGEKKDIANDFITFTARVIPPGGKISTVVFEIPRLDVDGIFKSGGVQYYMKKQQVDLPIRKISESEVALSSYYPTKLFVTRADYAAYNYTRWIGKQISLASMSRDSHLSKLRSEQVKQNTAKLPRCYTAIASRFSSFILKRDGRDIQMSFDSTKQRKVFSESDIALQQRFDAVLVGKGQNHLFFMGFDNLIFSYNTLTNTTGEMYTVEKFILNSDLPPVKDIAMFNVFGKNIPLAIVLFYQLGFKKTLKTLGVKARRSFKKSKEVGSTEVYLRFRDEHLYIDVGTDPRAAMIFEGMKHYHRGLLEMSINDLDDQTAISGMLASYGLSSRYGNEFTNVFDMFIDPITEKVLKQMGEPTDMVLLLLRAAELLVDDQHQDMKDTLGTRIRGAERFAGAIYRSIALACRKTGQQTVLSKQKIDIPPNEVKFAILTQDASIEIYDGINPIKASKSREVVTLGGTGGRSSDSLRTRESRLAHKNDKGIISEAGVDSGSVGAIMYLSPDPKFINKLGMVEKFDEKTDGVGSILSTSAQLAPCIEHDDSKRIVFAGIQNAHMIGCPGYQVPPLLTGNEQTFSYRQTDLFVARAEKPGKVTLLTNKAIVVTYNDGSKLAVEIGERFAKSAGNTIPHHIITELKEGDVVEVQDVITYNKLFFGRSWINPKEVFWKSGLLANVLMHEVVNAFEDSSGVTAHYSSKITVPMAEEKTILLDFDQRIHGLVEEGDEVKADSILCTIESGAVSSYKHTDDEAIASIERITDKNPTAGVNGRVSKIEVFYNGEEEDMNETLIAVVRAINRRNDKLNKQLGKEEQSGRVRYGMRIGGNVLEKKQLAIVVKMMLEVPAGVGDKIVVGNQAKSVIGHVSAKAPVTESGRVIDLEFQYKSVEARKILSPIMIGTTTAVLLGIGKEFVRIYEED